MKSRLLHTHELQDGKGCSEGWEVSRDLVARQVQLHERSEVGVRVWDGTRQLAALEGAAEINKRGGY